MSFPCHFSFLFYLLKFSSFFWRLEGNKKGTSEIFSRSHFIYEIVTAQDSSSLRIRIPSIDWFIKSKIFLNPFLLFKQPI